MKINDDDDDDDDAKILKPQTDENAIKNEKVIKALKHAG